MRQKMRMSLRLAAALLVLSVPAATLFGAAESEAAADERLAISLIPFTPRGTTLGPDTWTELYLEERYGVNLEPWYDIDAYDTSAIQVRLATGDLPNMGACQGSLGECVDTGMVREVPREMIMEHMPNWMRWQEHYAGDQKWERTTVDGVNYAIPTALSMASTGQVMGFRADWMRAVGYEPEPVPDREFFRGPDSIAEIEELLLKFRNADPDGDGRKDSYGYMVWKNSVDFQRTVLPNVFGSFGIQLHVWDVRDGAGYYSLVDPNYRDALIYVNTWWEQEIIHPDTPIAVRADVVRAMANDEFGAWSELDAWQSQYGAGPWGALREVHPDADIAYSITPVGPTGGRGTWYRNPNWGPISNRGQHQRRGSDQDHADPGGPVLGRRVVRARLLRRRTGRDVADRRERLPRGHSGHGRREGRRLGGAARRAHDQPRAHRAAGRQGVHRAEPPRAAVLDRGQSDVRSRHRLPAGLERG